MMKLKIFLIFILFLAGCSNKEEPTLKEARSSLSFNNIYLGFTEEQVVKIMGSPTTTNKINENKRYISYTGNEGPYATFYFTDNQLIKGYWYPPYSAEDTKILRNKGEINQLIFNSNQKVDCYEWTICNSYESLKGKEILKIQTDWTDKIIDVITLEYVN